MVWVVWVDGPHTGFMVDCDHPPFPLLAHGGTGPDGCCSIGQGFTSSVHGGLIAYGCMDRGLGSWWSRSNSISLSLAHMKPVQGGTAFFLLLLCFPMEFLAGGELTLSGDLVARRHKHRALRIRGAAAGTPVG